MYPMARSADLTVKRMADEVVVFDARNGSVHHLNRVAHQVWTTCDGRTDADAIARIVGRTLQVPDPGPAVELALEQLSRRGLLETTVERAPPARRRDRRAALRELVKLAAVPVVLSLTASQARAYNGTGLPCSVVCSRTVFLPALSPGLPDTAVVETYTVNGFIYPGGFCSAIC
jgi:hypothetical protein